MLEAMVFIGVLATAFSVWFLNFILILMTMRIIDDYIPDLVPQSFRGPRGYEGPPGPMGMPGIDGKCICTEQEF